MGSGIAQVAATAGRKVMIYDKNLDALIQSQEKLTKILDRLIVKERIDNKEKNRILNTQQQLNYTNPRRGGSS